MPNLSEMASSKDSASFEAPAALAAAAPKAIEYGSVQLVVASEHNHHSVSVLPYEYQGNEHSGCDQDFCCDVHRIHQGDCLSSALELRTKNITTMAANGCGSRCSRRLRCAASR